MDEKTLALCTRALPSRYASPQTCFEKQDQDERADMSCFSSHLNLFFTDIVAAETPSRHRNAAEQQVLYNLMSLLD